MKDAVANIDFLRCAPVEYYWCSSMPFIGLEDHANQTVRTITKGSFSDIRAFLCAFDKILGDFMLNMVHIDKSLSVYFNKTFPSPLLYPDMQNLDNLSENQWRKTEIFKSRQLIYYGAPGTGKSDKIYEFTKGHDTIRTTFHPDSDYSTFVGAYKPSMEPSGDKESVDKCDHKEIVYKFVAQSFLKAYTAAWKKMASGTREPQFLIIEEINRGNCAQIFGDLFQLLDRDDVGYSHYPIDADDDIRLYLSEWFKDNGITDIPGETRDVVAAVTEGKKLILPPNLYIWATMNTSDQSLFPIDSAFKRRWDWEYVPIAEGRDKATKMPLQWKIDIGERHYDWWQFVQAINKEIDSADGLEDKKLGYFFVKATDGIITADTLVNKVFFYLWGDVFKDEGFTSRIFKKREGEGNICFAEFFNSDGTVSADLVTTFLRNLNMDAIEEPQAEVAAIVETSQTES